MYEAFLKWSIHRLQGTFRWRGCIGFEADAEMAVCGTFRAAGAGGALFQRGFQTSAAERDPCSQRGAEKESRARAGRGAPVREGHAGRAAVPAELPV